MELIIDVGEVVALAERLGGLPRQAQAEWERAGRASGLAVQRLAQSRIPVDTGAAKGQTTMESVSASPAGVTVMVSSRAQSERGFPYPVVLEHGRGEIVARPGKTLRFTTKDGRVVYTKKVRSYPGTRFFSSSVEDAGPFIERAFSDAGDRIIAWVVS